MPSLKLPADIAAMTEAQAFAELERLESMAPLSPIEQLRLEDVEVRLEQLIAAPEELAAWRADVQSQDAGTYVDEVYEGPLTPTETVTVDVGDKGFRQGLLLLVPLGVLAWQATRKRKRR